MKQHIITERSVGKQKNQYATLLEQKYKFQAILFC